MRTDFGQKCQYLQALPDRSRNSNATSGFMEHSMLGVLFRLLPYALGIRFTEVSSIYLS